MSTLVGALLALFIVGATVSFGDNVDLLSPDWKLEGLCLTFFVLLGPAEADPVIILRWLLCFGDGCWA